jgi:peptidoglycan/xylan/chitin deacetylase (PgdA/CDA1 family)
MLKKIAREGLNAADRLCLAAGTVAGERTGMLVSVLFHSLYPDRSHLGDPALAPNQDVTVPVFRSFVEEMLDSGYSAVTPAEVDAGLDEDGRHLMITFDDGYFNNTLALDVLQEFRVPATFFISTDHVRDGKAFWWDAFSRHLASTGITGGAQRREIDRIKQSAPESIESELLRRFGDAALEPCGDLDRPFTVNELLQFAANPWVHLGNHTRNHAILTRCEPHEMLRQVSEGQQALADWTGRRPIAIAYPNGNHSPAAVKAATEAGLRLGFTVVPRAAPLPLAEGLEKMTVGRFLFHGQQEIRQQCRTFGARAVPSHWVRRMLHSAY